MNLLSDIDNLIIAMLDLPEKLLIGTINKHYNMLIGKLSIIQQYYIAYKHHIVYNLSQSHLYFCCQKGYVEYAEYLCRKKLHLGSLRDAFIYSCKFGHKCIAQLILNANDKYGVAREFFYLFRAFIDACSYNRLEIAKWLLDLSENHGYPKIDIHAKLYDIPESAFRYSCGGGHLDVAKWLIELGENGYGKINIHEWNENAFKSALGHSHVIEWLIDLGKNHGYGEIKPRYIYRAI